MSKKDAWVPLPWQIAPWKSTDPIILLSGSAGGGKAIALTTPILTAVGFLRMVDIKIGDIVFAQDGSPTHVVAMSPVYYDHDCYEIEFEDGSCIRCDKDHEWPLYVKDLEENEAIKKRENSGLKSEAIKKDESFGLKSEAIKRRENSGLKSEVLKTEEIFGLKKEKRIFFQQFRLENTFSEKIKAARVGSFAKPNLGSRLKKYNFIREDGNANLHEKDVISIRTINKLRGRAGRIEIVSIKKIEPVDVRCIQISHPSGLYLAGVNLVVTHNSTLAAQKAFGFALKYPGSTCLIVRKTRESMTNSTVLFLATQVVKGTGTIHVPTKRRFELTNGSYITYGGMKNEEQREQIRSIGAAGGIDFAWLEEATSFEEDDYNEILARMRGIKAPWTQVILTTNPGASTHWIKKRLIDGGEARVFLSSALDNSYNPLSYVENLNRLTGVLKYRLADGLWFNAEGAVFDEFEENVHVVSTRPREDEIAYTVGAVDWGFTSPGVMQIWAVCKDGNVCMVHETYKTGQLIDFWKNLGLVLQETYKVRTFLCDPSEPQNIAYFRSGGVNAIPANNAIFLGVQTIKQRLSRNKPRIFLVEPDEVDFSLVERKVPCSTIEEMPLYIWSDNKKKDIPVDANNHGIDAMRYAMTYIDQGVSSSFLNYLMEWAKEKGYVETKA